MTNKQLFDPKQIKSFNFDGATYDESSQTIELRYSFDDTYQFTETISFLAPVPSLSEQKKEVLEKAIRQLHLAAGISYFKAAVPKNISINSSPLTKDEAEFFNTFYRNGLGEFAYKNDLPLQGLVSFPYSKSKEVEPAGELSLRDRPLVPLGGGKDSLVTVERVKEEGITPTLVTVGDREIFRKLEEVSDLNRLVIKRKISPTLIEINKLGGYNGHVPITGIIHFILVIGVILYDFNSILFSNERSANEPNINYDGIDINHQYSKSEEFEINFQNHIERYILRGVSVRSYLRKLSELQICELFSKYEEYHPHFASCNANFSLTKNERDKFWCCACPKCCSVYLLLAPYLEKERLVEIFGEDLLNNNSLHQQFRELLGLDGHKPFECVGEISECNEALRLLGSTWSDSSLVPLLLNESELLNELEVVGAN